MPGINKFGYDLKTSYSSALEYQLLKEYKKTYGFYVEYCHHVLLKKIIDARLRGFDVEACNQKQLTSTLHQCSCQQGEHCPNGHPEKTSLFD